MDFGTPRRAAEPQPPPLFARWYVPLWIATVAAAWWAIDHDTLGPVVREARMGASIAAFMLALRFALYALEAFVYWTLWRARGVRMGLPAMWLALLTLSTIDALATRLVQMAELRHGAWSLVAAWLAGPAGIALQSDAGAFALAFGALGLLDMLRIVLWADYQRRAARCGWRWPLVFTLALWIATRFALAWGFDLMRGRSFAG